MDNYFFISARKLTAGQVADECGGELLTPHLADIEVSNLSSLENFAPSSLTFADGAGKDELVSGLRNMVLLCTGKYAGHTHESVAVVVVQKPQQAFAKIGRLLFPQSVLPTAFSTVESSESTRFVSKAAMLEDNVSVEPGAVVGSGCEIGSGTLIGAGAVIGDGVKIGRNCVIGPSATITHAFIGNGVTIHAGVRIGQDGFGYVAGPGGLEKMPQLGRVIIQDKVEIGANTTIDRGALDDTVIGEGTKIDNLVQIAHNCRIGRYCVITGHCGLSGSVTLGDGVMLGGRVGIADHVVVGDGAQIAAASGVMNNIGPNEKWAGLPAQPIKEFFREVAVIRSLVREKRDKAK